MPLELVLTCPSENFPVSEEKSLVLLESGEVLTVLGQKIKC